MALRCYSFARTGEDAAYLAFDIPLEQVEQGLAALKTLGVGGFNVTMPCKTAVAGLVDELSPAARLIGACNTVTVSQDGRLTGHNTDGIGFVRNLHENGVEVRGKRLVVLGAGGAATAICVQAALDGAAEIAIFNRDDEFFANGRHTVEKLAQVVPGSKASITPLEDGAALADAVQHCHILVNATRGPGGRGDAAGPGDLCRQRGSAPGGGGHGVRHGRPHRRAEHPRFVLNLHEK